MEITVLEACGLPGNSVVAINAGPVRREAELQVNLPIRIPKPGPESGRISLLLLHQLASQVLPEDAQSWRKDETGRARGVECTIPVPPKLGGDASEVKLRVSRPSALPMATSASGTVHTAMDFWGKQKMQAHLQTIVQEVLRTQPKNPYKYMLKRLKEARSQKLGADSEEHRDRAQPGHAPNDILPPSAAEDTQETLHMPKPPESPNGGSSPRRARTFAQAGSPKKGASGDIIETSRKEFGTDRPEVLKDTDLELRRGSHDADVKLQAKATIRHTLEKTAVLLSPDYRRSVTRWAVSLTVRGAASKLAHQDGRLSGCANQDDMLVWHPPASSASLGAGKNSWGAWLG